MKDTFKGCGLMTSIVIPNNVIYIEEAAFEGCSLRTITIGNKVKSIGKRAFFQSKITTISIPDSVENIEDEAFYDNNSLKSITIGTGIKRIGTRAFPSSSDRVCTIKAKTPPNMRADDLGSTDYYRSNIIIYVPQESLRIYKEAEGWKYYADKMYGR
jgi:putative surface protein bspA-like